MTVRSQLTTLCEALRHLAADTDQVIADLHSRAKALERASARAAAVPGSGSRDTAVAFQQASRACADAATHLRRCGELARSYAAAKCGTGHRALIGAIMLTGFDPPGKYPVGPDGAGYRVEPADRRHVLDVDGHGGGHRAGTGEPGKSEFPGRWNEDDIFDRIADVARAPDTVLLQPPAVGREHDEARWIAISRRDDVTVFIVLRLDGSLVTAFPRDGRGVVVNPARSS